MGEGHGEEHDEHGGNSGIQTHTCTQPVVLVGPIHQLNGVCKKKTKGRISCKEIDYKSDIIPVGKEIAKRWNCKAKDQITIEFAISKRSKVGRMP